MGSNSSMLIIQDDVYSGALHLDEVLLSAIPGAEGGAAAFAFVTKDGLNAIFNSEEFKTFCDKGHHFELYIGIDSITNAKTLSFAKELSKKLKGRLIVKVYYDDSTPDIFHAKTTWFRNPGGSGSLAFVGSGNLTMRGLQKNVEMFSWIEQDKEGFEETQKTWNGWLDDAGRAGRIYEVDDPFILDRADKNRFFRRANAQRGGKKQSEVTEVVVPEEGRSLLISTIPKQTGRGWSQFAMAKEYYTGYFAFEVDESGDNPMAIGSRRVLLNSVNDDGTTNPTESRAGNISSSSRNFRIELEAARGVTVSNGGFPIAVFLKTGPRSYLYQIFGTDSPYNSKLAEFAKSHNQNLPVNQHPKCWIDAAMLKNRMPDLPIFNVREEEGE